MLPRSLTPARVGLLLIALSFADVAAFAGDGNGYIKVKGHVVYGWLDVMINGTQIQRIWLGGDPNDNIQHIVGMLNAFGPSGINAQIDPRDSSRILLAGGVRALGLQTNLPGAFEWGVDPPPPILGSLTFLAGTASGRDPGGAASEVRLYLNGTLISVAPGAGESVPDLLTRIAADLTTAGYTVDVTAGGLRLNARSMPGGVPITALGWWSDDVGLAALGPVLMFQKLGDMNCDDVTDFSDINPFVQALSDPAGYQTAYPGCWLLNADVNGDGSLDFYDINAFVALLSGS
ncbi:MAG: hypothetical protein AB1716_05335 [Planctomycetota bacterium]